MEINADEDCQPPSLLIYAGVEALVHVDVGHVEGLPGLGDVPSDAFPDWKPEEKLSDHSFNAMQFFRVFLNGV